MYYNGFHGDLNETFFVGNVDERSKKLVRVSYECLDLAIKEGMMYAQTNPIYAVYSNSCPLKNFNKFYCPLPYFRLCLFLTKLPVHQTSYQN